MRNLSRRKRMVAAALCPVNACQRAASKPRRKKGLRGTRRRTKGDRQIGEGRTTDRARVGRNLRGRGNAKLVRAVRRGRNVDGGSPRAASMPKKMGGTAVRSGANTTPRPYGSAPTFATARTNGGANGRARATKVVKSMCRARRVPRGLFATRRCNVMRAAARRTRATPIAAPVVVSTRQAPDPAIKVGTPPAFHGSTFGGPAGPLQATARLAAIRPPEATRRPNVKCILPPFFSPRAAPPPEAESDGREKVSNNSYHERSGGGSERPPTIAERRADAGNVDFFLVRFLLRPHPILPRAQSSSAAKASCCFRH